MNKKITHKFNFIDHRDKTNFQDLKVKLGGPNTYWNLKISSMSLPVFPSSFPKFPPVSTEKE